MSVPAEVAATVAANTRRLRTERGWSLDAFATRSGVSKGMLVQIEQARTNPSLGTLCRMAEAFSVTLAALVEVAERPMVHVVPAGEGTVLWRGEEGGEATLLVGSDEREHVELWHWAMEPGDEHRTDTPHVPGTLEMVHVLAGELTLEVDGQPHSVPEGAAASYPGDLPHAYRNEGGVTCRFGMVLLQNDADLQAWAAGRITPGA